MTSEPSSYWSSATVYFRLERIQPYFPCYLFLCVQISYAGLQLDLLLCPGKVQDKEPGLTIFFLYCKLAFFRQVDDMPAWCYDSGIFKECCRVFPCKGAAKVQASGRTAFYYFRDTDRVSASYRLKSPLLRFKKTELRLVFSLINRRRPSFKTTRKASFISPPATGLMLSAAIPGPNNSDKNSDISDID